MLRRPPGTTLTATLFPYTTLFRSHDHAVRGEDLVVMIGGQIALVRPEGDRLLRAHHQRVGKAAQQHDDPEHHIHDTDLLVIDAGDPVAPQDTPPAIPGDQTEHGDAAERDADEGDRKSTRLNSN